jgi:PAS domain S-box-containing protein
MDEEVISVLHVDDDAAFGELVSEFLTQENEKISVITVEDTNRGREVLATQDIDCIVSDYDMPEENGLEFLASVREKYEKLPFILFTGKGSEEIASQAISAGVTDYLQKNGGTDTYTILANRIKNAVEQYRVERTARKTERRLHAITDSAADVIVNIGRDGVIRFVNPAVEDVFGYTPDEVEGKSLSTLIPEELWDDQRDALARYLETGTRSVNWDAIEVYGRHKDGSEIPLSVSYSEFTLDGEVYFTGIIRDISERVRLEQQLEKGERQLHELGDQLQEIVWVTDPTREHLLYVNPRYEEVWGRSIQSLFDDPMSFVEAVHPDDRERVKTLLDERPSVAYDIEYRIVHPEVGTRWVRDRSIPVPNGSGTVERIIGIAEDITQRKEYEHRIERQLTQSTEFAGVLSHDLSTPLSTAQGRIQLAQETGDMDHLTVAARAVRRIEEIVNEVSRIMQEEAFVDDLTELDIESMVREVWAEIDTADASLTIADTATIQADRSAFKRLLENLFKNAIEHGGPSVNVRVGTLNRGLFIEDDGPGIPKEAREDIFVPGFTTKEEGQGLGLASVSQIVQGHNWKIQVGETKGEGVRFEVLGVEFV